MKVGDLISFKPVGFSDKDWSPPCIVIREFEPQALDNLWVVWCEGADCIVDEINYDVAYLIEGCANGSGRLG